MGFSISDGLKLIKEYTVVDFALDAGYCLVSLWRGLLPCGMKSLKVVGSGRDCHVYHVNSFICCDGSDRAFTNYKMLKLRLTNITPAAIYSSYRFPLISLPILALVSLRLVGQRRSRLTLTRRGIQEKNSLLMPFSRQVLRSAPILGSLAMGMGCLIRGIYLMTNTPMGTLCIPEIA